MSKVSPFHKSLLRDNATFASSDILVSRDCSAWAQAQTVLVLAEGAIVAEDKDGTSSILLSELQLCQVQIHANAPVSTLAPRRRFAKTKLDAESAVDEPPVIFIKLYNNCKLYLKVASKLQFGNLVLALMAWQNMKPQGLAKKWFAQNKVWNLTLSTLDPHELLVCRFKIYAPIPAKTKNINLVRGPRAPIYMDECDSHNYSLLLIGTQGDHAQEGWFYTMGVLKSNGILNFITELDGTLLYSVDIKKVLLSEIREIHHSICNLANILFIGNIKELRWNSVIKPTLGLSLDTIGSQSLFSREGKPVANSLRILIEFPLHIDLEDWLVGLNYFCKREYIGIYNEKSVLINTPVTRVVDLEGTLDADSTLDGTSKITSSTSNFALKENGLRNSLLLNPPPTLDNFTRDHLRVSKKVTIDIIEAKFDNIQQGAKPHGKIYAEVMMWGYPWARTAMVPHNHNPFWKEEFSTDLPILTQMVRIVIKKCLGDTGYGFKDKIIGTVYLTPDILTQQLRTFSTMMVGTNSGEGITLPGLLSLSHSLSAAAAAAPQNNNTVRLSIYDAGNLPIGKLLLTVDLKEYLILPPSDFRTLESMLLNCPMKQLIEFCSSNVGTSELENVSFMLLDIFQSLGVEDKWFKALIEVELVSVDKMTRKNYAAKSTNTTSSNNVFNTLFRGSSIFTKSLEKYIFRIGQEYLEKVFGNFFEKVSAEKKNCEIDPRYVRLQVKAERKRKSSVAIDGEEPEEDDGSDKDFDSEEEDAQEQRVKEIIDENFENLCGYAEDIWLKIYTTSNDLPQQIKSQLKNFRTKVDLACDPSDKVTALNCLSAFIFLRFFCPAILNPKLFYLTKDHQTGYAQRTLTLIAKILLNLANRQQFSPHKEPHLVKMNDFLKKHEPEVYDYFDKVTGRKNDFNEKILSLSHEMKRFDLGLSGDLASSELPTTPYLIDKYLRLTEFIHLLQLTNQPGHLRLASSVSSISINTTISLTPSVNRQSQTAASQPRRSFLYEREGSLDSNDEIQVNNERNVYQIGSLEFEKSEFLDLAGDNETEGFIKSLCRSNEEIFSFITSNITLKDLQKQSTNIVSKITELSQQLQQPEECRRLQGDKKLWEAYVNNIVDRASLDTTKNSIVFNDPHFQDGQISGQRRLVDNALSFLKLKFPGEYQGGKAMLVVESFSSTSLGTLRNNTKNPFKRWLKRD